MATAEELLSGMSSRDRTFVIDSDLRTIIIPRGINNLGVESDDDVMKVEFRMPAEYCGTRLNAFKVRINYLNANAEPDTYEVKGVSTNADDTLSFSWLVGRHAAMYKGDVKFNVCLRDIDDGTGKVNREFNTTIATLPILEGLETGEQAIAEYNDIFEQWRADLFGAGNSAVSMVEDAQNTALRQIANARDEAIATIPADYTATANAADESVRTKADAIVRTAQGGVVSIADASDDHMRGLRLLGRTTQVVTTGKNLLDAPEVATWKGVVSKSLSIPAGTYVLSYASSIWHGANPPHVRFATNDKWFQLDATGESIIVTFDKEETQLDVYSNGSSANNSEGVSATIKQLMLSVSGGEYEPFSNAVPSPSPEYSQPLLNAPDATVAVRGKNLIDMASHPKYDSGAVRVEYSSGNGMDSAFSYIPVVPGETYTFSYEYEGGDRIVVKLMDADEISLGKVDLGWGTYLPAYNGTYGPVGDTGVSITVPQGCAARWMAIHLCQMLDCGTGNYNIYRNIQLEHGSVATEYEPYIEPQTIYNTNRDENVGLPGLPVTEGGNYTDSSGQQWVCDEVDFARGVYIKRFDTATFRGGSEGWSQYYNGDDGVNQFCVMANDCYINDQQINAMSPQLRGISVANIPFNYGTVYTAYQSEHNCVCMNMSGFDDVASFKAFLEANPITVIYRLTEPVEIALSTETIAMFKELHTNHLVTTVTNDGATFMEVSYNADLQTYIDNHVGSGVDVQTIIDGDGKHHVTINTVVRGS